MVTDDIRFIRDTILNVGNLITAKHTLPYIYICVCVYNSPLMLFTNMSFNSKIVFVYAKYGIW